MLTPDQYTVTDKDLTIPAALLLDEFVLEIVTKLDAGANTSLSGLYKSSGLPTLYWPSVMLPAPSPDPRLKELGRP